MAGMTEWYGNHKSSLNCYIGACGLNRPPYDGSLPDYRSPKLFSAVTLRIWTREESMPQLAKALVKRGVVMWKSSRQYIRWIAGLTLLATILSGGLVACGAADDSGDDRLSRLDRRETREARAERDDRRTTEAESTGDRSERIGSLFQRRSLEEPVEVPAATAALPAPAATAALPAAVPATALPAAAEATVPAPRVFNGRDDHSDDIDGATALSSSRPTRGDLETRGDADYFSFRAERGVRYVIETTSDFSTDTFITLLDGSYEMQSDDDGGTDGGSRITWTAPDDGTYYVAVTGYATATGMYELSLGDLRERLRSAARISPGASIEGRLGEGSDEDYYSFRADRGVYYDIEAHLLTHPDTVMRLFDSDGYEIASNDDGGADGGSRIRWEASEDGTYYIVVSAFDGDYTGSYRLTLER